MNRAVIYCRVSSEDQVKNLSLDLQEKNCRDYCQRQEMAVDKIFIEKGESAKTINRTEFQNLLKYCRQNKGRLHYVVVYACSRFARNNRDHFAVQAVLQSLGISLRSVTEPIDETSTGKLMEGMLAAFAQFDNDQRSDRTKAGMKEALERGRWPFRQPIGYRRSIDPSGITTVIIDEERGPLVRRAFELMATKLYEQERVRQIVETEGLRTAKGKRLPKASFSVMLRNNFYAGWLRSHKNGGCHRGQHAPLVSQQLFDEVPN